MFAVVGFEPGSCGVGGGCSVYCVTTTLPKCEPSFGKTSFRASAIHSFVGRFFKQTKNFSPNSLKIVEIFAFRAWGYTSDLL